jgi:hypothetical protein
MSSVDQFFSGLSQLGSDVERSIVDIRSQLKSRNRTEDQFIPNAAARINVLDTQTMRMKKCLFSQKSTNARTNLSLQYILSICQIILDENEILLDDIEDMTQSKVSLSRETLYDNALQIYRDSQELEQQLQQLPEPGIRGSISRLSTSAMALPLATPTKQTHVQNIHSTPVRVMSTPLNTKPNQIPSIRTPLFTQTSQPQVTQAPPLSYSSQDLAPIDQKELDTLPSYLTSQIPSLQALNECVAVIGTMRNGVTQSQLRLQIPKSLEEKHIRAVLLIMLKLKRFARTSRNDDNELTYFKN